MASKTKALDQAFKLFHDKKFKNAAEKFEKILGDDAHDFDVKAEAEKFLAICQRQLQPKATTDEESLKFVFYYMNIGEFAKATEILAKVDATPGTAEYLLAEMAMEQEEETEACTQLEKAIEANPDFRGYALNSIVFAPHLTKSSFNFLHGTESEEA